MPRKQEHVLSKQNVLEIPPDIAEAVYSGDMPFGIFADWLDDFNWPQAAAGFRLFDSKRVTIESLVMPKPGTWGGRINWKRSRTPGDISKLCQALAWATVPLSESEAGALLTKPWVKRHTHQARRKCLICGKNRGLSKILVCKPCHNAAKDLDSLVLPPKSDW